MVNDILSASFVGGGFSPSRLEKITVAQKFGSHTVTFLDYKVIQRPDYRIPAERSPMKARWGTPPLGVNTFYGYVNHHETYVGDEDNPYTRVVCLGTSRVMNTSKPGSWSRASRSSIARDIARRHSLRSVIHAHPHKVDSWVIGQRSDWQALKALAEETGYRLWVDGSTLFFLNPKKLLTGANAIDRVAFSPSDIKSVKIMGGSNIPGEMKATKRASLYGLDRTTNKFFEITVGDPRYPSGLVNQSVSSYEEAQVATDSSQRLEADYYVVRVTARGNANVHPGTLMFLGNGSVNTDQAGYWLVTEATHEITQEGRFVTKIVGVRREDNSLTARTTSTVRRAGMSKTGAILRDSKIWVAPLQEHVNV